MADNERDLMAETSQQRQRQTSDPDGNSPDADGEDEREQIRSSNDHDQELEREGDTSRHNRGYDDAVGRAPSESTGDVDPDSAASENDRDDTIDE